MIDIDLLITFMIKFVRRIPQASVATVTRATRGISALKPRQKEYRDD